MRTMNNTTKLLAILTLSVIPASHAWALSTGITQTSFEPSAFDPGSRPFIETLVFNGPSGMGIDGASLSSNVRFTSPEANDPSRVFVISSSDAVADNGGSSRNDVGPIRADFLVDITAFSFRTTNAGRLPEVTVFAKDGSTLEVFTAAQPNGFVGFVANEPLGGFVLLGNLADNNGSRDRVGMTDMNLYSVPEPASAGLLAAAGLLCISRRRLASGA